MYTCQVDSNACKMVYDDNEEEYEDFYDYTALDGEDLIERTRGALVLKRPDILQSRVTAALREDA